MDWTPIPGFPGYEAHPSGEIRSWVRKGPGGYRRIEPLLLKPCIQNGYAGVGMKGRRWKVHRTILLTFVGPSEPGQVGRHLNGNSLDNRLINLAWGSPQENSDDRKAHGRAIAPNKLVTPEIKAVILASKDSSRVLGVKLGLHHSTIRKYRKGVYQ